MKRFLLTVASVAMAFASVGLSAYAQTPGYTQAPGFNAPGFAQNGASSYGPGNFTPPSASQRTPPQTAPTLPEGIDHIYALEGNNALLLYGTQEGYETARQLIKDLDGDLDLTRTEITYARATPEYLAALGVTVPADGRLSAGDVQKLVDARRAGEFAGTDTLRIKSREDFENAGTVGGCVSALPVVEDTDVTEAGGLRVSLRQPVRATLTLRPDQMSVVALPPTGGDAPVSLLFVTASVLPG